MRLTVTQKILIAKIANFTVRTWRAIFGKGATGEFNRGGLRWNLDLNEGIDLAIYLSGAYEPDTVAAYKKLLSPGSVVIDIGANIGAHTLYFAKFVSPGGRVVAVEPTDFAFGKLKRNVELNPAIAPAVTALQCLLLARPDDSVPDKIYSSWPVTATSGTTEETHPTHLGRLQTLTGARPSTLDDLAEAQGLNSVTLIKLDVDGNELAVLQGGTKTLKRFRPSIIVELAPFVYDDDPKDANGFDELIRFVKDLSYDIYSLDGKKLLPQTSQGLDAIIPKGAGLNVLLKPAQV